MKEDKKIVLENGIVIAATGFGDLKQNPIGELVFTTAMSGYQETLTDPSYKDQIIVFSYPIIGNYGINIYDEENSQINASAIIVNELSEDINHFSANQSLSDYLKQNNILGVRNVDTRFLTKILRENGALKCKIVDAGVDEVKVIEELKDIIFNKHVSKVSTKMPYHIPGTSKRVALIDFGYKRNIMKELVKRNLEIYVFPYDVSIEEIDKIKPDGILLSNGPGDPKELSNSIKMVQKLIGKYPIFGICLGHQLYALAIGAETFKMKYGHRGINHSVRNEIDKKVYITSQNHGYCVDAKSLQDKDIAVLYTAVNDGSVEGLINCKTNDFTVQFHPESHPGPNDTSFLFDDFVKIVRGEKDE